MNKAMVFYNTLVDEYCETKNTSILVVARNLVNAKKVSGLLEDLDLCGGYELRFIDHSKVIITANEDVWLYN